MKKAEVIKNGNVNLEKLDSGQEPHLDKIISALLIKSWDEIKKEFMKDNAFTESSPNDVFDFLKEAYPDGVVIKTKSKK